MIFVARLVDTAGGGLGRGFFWGGKEGVVVWERGGREMGWGGVEWNGGFFPGGDGVRDARGGELRRVFYCGCW